MAANWRFRFISDICGDLATYIAGLKDDDSASLFADVQTHRKTKYAEIAQIIENASTFPACIIVPGAGTIPKEGARSKRETGISLFIVSDFYAEMDEETLDTISLADYVTNAFQPVTAAKSTKKVINNVIYEPTGHTPIDLIDHQDVIEVGLLAIDFMRDRSS